MSHSDYHTLINRGRKAGLGATELYQALAGRPPEEGDHNPGQADCNGFVLGYNQAGQRIYRPIDNSRHP